MVAPVTNIAQVYIVYRAYVAAEGSLLSEVFQKYRSNVQIYHRFQDLQQQIKLIIKNNRKRY